jgi:hypothetical protein
MTDSNVMLNTLGLSNFVRTLNSDSIRENLEFACQKPLKWKNGWKK